MPYIKKCKRVSLDAALKQIDFILRTSQDIEPGDITYLITKITKGFILNRGVSYTSISATIGILETAKHEIERRMLDPYENGKCRDNGDVF